MNVRLLPFELPFFLPPTELLIIESLFLLIVFICCALIFIRTYSVFKLTEHTGIKYFRSIFLHFGLAYFFRLIHFFLLGLVQFANTAVPKILFQLNLFFVGYFSTMALLSVAVTLILRIKEIDTKKIHIMTHIMAISFALYFATSNSLKNMALFQGFIAFCLFIIIVYTYLQKHSKSILNQNNITYGLLVFFWGVGLITANGKMLSFGVKSIFYIISATVFIWITQRVTRRLASGKKTRSS